MPLSVSTRSILQVIVFPSSHVSRLLVMSVVPISGKAKVGPFATRRKYWRNCRRNFAALW
jgi:hypothetical protein